MKNGFGPADEMEWLDEQRERIVGYLPAQGIDIGEDDLDIEWSLPPAASLWAARLADGGTV